MKILFTNKALNFAAGTQVIVRDLAVTLLHKGWQVAVYTPEAGAFANEIRNKGVFVSNSLEEIPFVPDVIHAHHYKPALQALSFFTDTPAISFIHDRLSPIDIPPRHRRIMKYLASDFNVKDRLVKDVKVPESHVDVLLNWVDVSKFPLRQSWNERPQRALVFSNYATRENYYSIIKQACAEEGIELDAVGKHFQLVNDPGPILCKYDLVFAKAKAAMEALATGAVVITCDKFGLGEMVTLNNFDRYRRFNFGMKILERPVKKTLLVDEIRKYDVADAEVLAAKIRTDADYGKYVNTMIVYYQNAIENYKNGLRTYHKEVKFNPVIYWLKRKLMSRKRELQKQVRRFKRRLKYGR